MKPSEPTRRAAPRAGRSRRAVAVDEAVAGLVAEALSDATPRSATLALLRFDDYLGMLRRAGLDVCPRGALAGALRAGLTRICRADGAATRSGPRSAPPDGT